MRLTINKSYNLFTKKETLMYKKVKVLGVLNYDEAQLLPDSIIKLAINEAVIDSDDTDNYLKQQEFYKLQVLDGTNSIITAWDDIIDFDKTTELDIDFYLTSIIKINANSTTTIDDVKKTIDNALLDKYNGNVDYNTFIAGTSTSSLNQQEESINETVDKLKQTEEMLAKTTEALESIVRLHNKTETLYVKLEELGLVSNLTSISDKIATIESDIKEIYQLLS